VTVEQAVTGAVAAESIVRAHMADSPKGDKGKRDSLTLRLANAEDDTMGRVARARVAASESLSPIEKQPHFMTLPTIRSHSHDRRRNRPIVSGEVSRSLNNPPVALASDRRHTHPQAR
jgi:hypothetical protein